MNANKDFSSVSKKAEEKKLPTKNASDLFAESALIKSKLKSKYYLNLIKEVIACVNSVPEVNSQLTSFGIENLKIDSSDMEVNLSVLFDIKIYQKLVKDLKFTDEQYNLLVNNYIMKRTFPKDIKESNQDWVKKTFEKLSGKK